MRCHCAEAVPEDPLTPDALGEAGDVVSAGRMRVSVGAGGDEEEHATGIVAMTTSKATTWRLVTGQLLPEWPLIARPGR